MKHLCILLIPTFLFCGCASVTDPATGKTSQQFSQAKLEAWWSDPKTQTVVSTIEQVGFQIGVAMLESKVKDPNISSDIALAARTLEGQQVTSAQIVQVAGQWGAPPASAASLASAVTAAQKQGVPADVAKEALARGLDNASVRP